MTPVVFGNSHADLRSLTLTSNPLALASLLGFAGAVAGPPLAGTEGLIPGGGGIPSIGVVISALQSTNDVNVISTPHVMVTDNSPALISIGERIPYAGDVSISNGVTTTSTQFLDVAITLNVTPHISPGNHIMMDIDQVVDSLLTFIQVAPGQQAPRTTSRRAGTTVIVQNDQTVVLGGIISKNQTTLPVSVLDRAGLAAGDEVRVEAVGAGRILLTRPTAATEQFAGCLTGIYGRGYLTRLRREGR